MRSNNFKEYIDRRLENESIPQFPDFKKNLPEKRGAMPFWLQNLMGYTAAVAFAAILLTVNFHGETSYKEPVKKFCQEYNCSVPAYKRKQQVENYLQKIKAYLNKEA